MARIEYKKSEIEFHKWVPRMYDACRSFGILKEGRQKEFGKEGK